MMGRGMMGRGMMGRGKPILGRGQPIPAYRSGQVKVGPGG